MFTSLNTAKSAILQVLLLVLAKMSEGEGVAGTVHSSWNTESREISSQCDTKSEVQCFYIFTKGTI